MNELKKGKKETLKEKRNKQTKKERKFTMHGGKILKKQVR